MNHSIIYDRYQLLGITPQHTDSHHCTRPLRPTRAFLPYFQSLPEFFIRSGLRHLDGRVWDHFQHVSEGNASFFARRRILCRLEMRVRSFNGRKPFPHTSRGNGFVRACGTGNQVSSKRKIEQRIILFIFRLWQSGKVVPIVIRKSKVFWVCAHRITLST